MNWRLFLLWPLIFVAIVAAMLFLWPYTLFVDPTKGTNFEGDRVKL